MFIDISQNSLENNCDRVSLLIKLQASSLQLYLKRDSRTGVFREISKNHFSYKTLPVAASEYTKQSREMKQNREETEKI